MVAAAKVTGAGHIIWPKGYTAEDIPADVFNVINHALVIVGWQENLTEEEMPEYWKWHLDWEIEAHFLKVKRMREAKYSNGTTPHDPMHDTDEQGNALFEKNALFDEFIQ